MAFVTLKGINDAVSNLALRPGTLQDRLLSTLSSYFPTEENLQEITSISSDELVKILWDVDSQEEIRKKRKNLSSLKSAINKRFKELTKLDQNPEGLIIGKDNVYTISEEHKNSLLNKLGITSGSAPAMDFLSSMREVLGALAKGGDSSQLQSILSELDKTKEIIDRLVREKEEGADLAGEEDGSKGTTDVEEIELAEDEEIIVIGGQQTGGSYTGSDAGDVRDESSDDLSGDAEDERETGASELPGSFEGDIGPGKGGGDIPGPGQDAETGQPDEGGPGSAQQDIEILDDEELVEDEIDQEILEEEDVPETEEIIEDEILEEGDAEDERETGASELPGSAEEDIGPEEGGGDIPGPGQDAETGQPDEGGPGSAQQDIEILDDEELVEEFLDENEIDQEILEEEDAPETEEIIEDEILEEEFEEIEDLLEEGDAEDEKETGAGELPGSAEEDIGPEEGGGDIPGPGQDAETGQPDEGGPGSAQQDIEILDDEELVEEFLDEDEIDQEIIEEELLDEEEIEEVEDLLEEGDKSSDGPEGNDEGGRETGAGELPGSAEEDIGPEEGNSDITGPGQDIETGQPGEGGPGSAQQDIEILDDEELVEEFLDEDEIDQEILEEELLDEEEIEEVEDLLEEGDKSSDGPEGNDEGGPGSAQQDIEILDDEELVEEFLDEDEIDQEILEEELLDEEEIEEVEDLLEEGDDEGGPGSAQQDIEILDDEELVEEFLDEDEIDQEILEEEDAPEPEEIIEEDDLLEVSEKDLVEKEDGIGVGEGAPSLSGTGDEPSDLPLEMSRYIDPSEALENLPDTLNESNDEFISMIMQRFMPPFIQIPAGNYRIGCKTPKSMDRPEQNVILKKYHISQIPVTNDIFDFFIRETGYETDAEKKGYGIVVEGRFSKKLDPETGRASLIINPVIRFQHVEGANWRHPKGPYSSLDNKASHPVVQISRRDAIAFASWAGKKLPSEDEWEAAARGDAGHLFPWGDEWLDTYGNFESSQAGDTTPVTHYGKEAMSPFGLLDMLGNVLEWTSSRPHSADNERSPRLSILKGGSWATGGIITAATRFLERDDTWSNIISFRCAV